jgi:MoaA/NifB/PqqE/SkfB family radical SAM enzyme
MAFGRIGERSFRQIWNSPEALKLRRSIRNRRDRPHFCVRCPYQDKAMHGTELWCRELISP